MCCVMPPASPVGNIRFANRVQQTCFAVIDVAHHRNYRRPRLQVFLGLILRNFENHFLFEGNDGDYTVECFRDLRRGRNVERLVDAREHAAIHQRLQQIFRAHIELFRKLANLDTFGNLHIARRTRLGRRNYGGDASAHLHPGR